MLHFDGKRGEQPFDEQGGEVPETDGQLQVIRQVGGQQIAGLDRESCRQRNLSWLGWAKPGLVTTQVKKRARSRIQYTAQTSRTETWIDWRKDATS